MANLQSMPETWANIPSFEGLYFATEDGYIWAHVKIWYSGKNKQIRKQNGIYKLKPSLSDDGYLRVSLCNEGKTFYRSVHRLIALTYHTNPDNKPEVNHIDGNKLNNAKNNLEWATSSENKIHAFKTGLRVPSVQKKGEENWKSKLTNQQAVEILNSSESYRALGKKYGVHNSIIGRIKNRTSYN